MTNWFKASILSLLIASGFAHAGPEQEVFTFSNVSTSGNTTAQTNVRPESAWIEGINIDLSGYASPTVDVDVVTLDGRTIYSKDNIVADVYLPVRIAAVSTAGAGLTSTETKIPVPGGRYHVLCGNAGTTGVVVSVTVIVSK